MNETTNALASQATAELPSEERERILKAAALAMPFTNPLIWQDWQEGHTVHTEADDIIAIWQAAEAAGRVSRAQSEWQTPPASWRLLAKAAIELLCAIDAKHDTERPPTKYSVPYGAVNQLRSALGCAEDQPATLGETK